MVSVHPDAANAFAEEFMSDYNRQFTKPSPQDFDVHRPLGNDKNQAATFTWCEQRKVSKTPHYSMIKSSIYIKIMKKTDVDPQKIYLHVTLFAALMIIHKPTS
ncbi:transposase [Klebsiella variicola]|nr:transposase [Klebsiella variicola]